MSAVLHRLARHASRVAILLAAACAGHVAAAFEPDGLLPGDNAPLPLAYRQSLFAGYQDDHVGTAVSLSGDLLAVGVPEADAGSAADAGRVDVYRWLAGEGRWMRITSYTANSFGIPAVANARFGAAVSLSRQWLLIGCPGCAPDDEANAILLRIPDEVEFGDGAVADAVRGGLEWYRATPPDLVGFSDPLEGTGAAVALSVVRVGSVVSPGVSVVLAVGSPKATYGVLDRGIVLAELGAVAMGRLDSGLQQVVWESGPWHGATEFGKYGKSLALSAATWVNLGFHANERDLLVGEPAWVAQGESGVHGRAVLWRRSGSSWSDVQVLTADSPGFLDGLASAVAVERADNVTRGVIALGAPGRVVDGTPGGGVLLFRQQVLGGDYVFEQQIQHTGAALADRFGGALALSGGRLLAGADGRVVDAFANAGAAYLYRYEYNLLVGDYRWRLKQALTEPPENGGNGAFGYSVALGPRAAAIGAPLSDAAGLVNAGRVVTYLCDRIFRDVFDGADSQACPGP